MEIFTFSQILTFFLLATILNTVYGICMTPSRNASQVIKVKETKSSGTVLTSFTSDDGEEFDPHVVLSAVSTPAENKKLLRDYLFLDIKNSTYYITLKKELDLELLNVIMGAVNNFTVYVTCIPSSVGDQTTETAITIEILPVNEFPPVFYGAPYIVKVPEETSNGTVVFDLSKRVHDEDIDPLSALTYRLYKYMIREFDGSRIFSIPNKEEGQIILDKPVDYEALKTSGMVFYILNVSVVDSGGLQVTTTINMTITDSDDLGPEFIYPGCGTPCEELSLELTTHENYTGPLTLEPTHLSARDRDTLNSTILYNFIPDEDNFTDYFSLDLYTADLYQTKPLTDTKVSTIELKIQATENTTKGYSVIANLTIIIQERAEYK